MIEFDPSTNYRLVTEKYVNSIRSNTLRQVDEWLFDELDKMMCHKPCHLLEPVKNLCPKCKPIGKLSRKFAKEILDK